MTSITFLTTTNNGSYDRLASRQAEVLEKEQKVKSEILRLAQVNTQKINSKNVVIYTTFNIVEGLINKYKEQLKGKRVVALLDSALYTIPYLRIEKLIRDSGIQFFTTSRFNETNFETLGIKIDYLPHFVPDLNPEGKIKSWSERDYDFLTVGINEADFDRKGHYWNWVVERWGFTTKRVCTNWCPQNSSMNVSEQELFSLYPNSKWYLATSHAESPHLPLIEAYSFGTPAVCLDAHEFHYICRGIYIQPAYYNVKGMKNFYFAEIDSLSFLEAIGKSRSMTMYETYQKSAREFFEDNYSMQKRLDQFRGLFDYEI